MTSNGNSQMNDIHSIMIRMERVEEVINNARSKWAKDHWTYVLQYLHRQLKYRGYK